MTPQPWLDDGDVKLYAGDALEQLALMPSESVQCIVTSPPFWGLRDYGTGTWTGGDAGCDHVQRQARQDAVRDTPGGRGGSFADSPIQFSDACGKCGARRVDQQIGLEETPDEWCARLVRVMREARRVLRNDGVCWIEVGDTYAGSWGNQGRKEERGTQRPVNGGMLTPVHDDRYPSKASNTGAIPEGCDFKPKDLVGAPWLLAFALRADGWYLRSDTIWARPNPMPESVTDRPTKAHSYVFLLTKSARYFYDADAIREPASDSTLGRWGAEPLRTGTPHAIQAEQRGDHGRERVNGENTCGVNPAGRNARSVWSIATEPTPFAHFATFPTALVERCIKAGTSEHGACGECCAPWRRITERTPMEVTPTAKRSAWQATDDHARTQVGGTMTKPPTSVTTGWEPSCECRTQRCKNAHPECAWYSPAVTPCVVLDPFMGSGTTALVARRLGRHAIGIELNAEYLAIAATRLQQLSLLGGHA